MKKETSETLVGVKVRRLCEATDFGVTITMSGGQVHGYFRYGMDALQTLKEVRRMSDELTKGIIERATCIQK